MAVKTETYNIVQDATSGERVTVQLSVPLLKADNLGLATWGSSYVLSNLLHRLNPPNLGSTGPVTVLELGAGTGLVGLSAAALWKTDVVLTDLAPILPGLAANIALNRALLDANAARVSCGMLDWNTPERLLWATDLPGTIAKGIRNDEANKASVILAADTMYWEHHPRLISQSIFAWLKKSPDARAVVCYSMRTAYLECMQEFYERMENGGMELVLEGREELPNDEWDDEKLYEWNVWRWKN
ncbi:hypothetical protein AURDEDRAFT_187738 [Auricularia subglabra TFB-10046 SS5]|nr:hypothetical protein AURDEDRAFT_187738 [Auricularia subglabra TFB-10046 SS5]